MTVLKYIAKYYWGSVIGGLMGIIVSGWHPDSFVLFRWEWWAIVIPLILIGTILNSMEGKHD